MVSTLYILAPAKADASHSSDWQSRPFAVTSAEGAVQQHGEATLTELRSQIQSARAVVLLLAASDVNLLRIKVPPLSAAKLKVALPNLVEEHVLGDPNDCVLLAHMLADGMCQVAVSEKKWLTGLYQQFHAFGAKKISALPLQLCLHTETGSATAVAAIEKNSIELSLRSALHDGAGLSLQISSESTMPEDVVQALTILQAEGDINLYVPATQLRAFEATQLPQTRLSLKTINWETRIRGIGSASFDMMSGIRNNNATSFNWKLWRWPVYLAVAVLGVNILALNLEWFSMKREAQRLDETILQTFRNAYPKEKVIADPMLQMQQKIKLAERSAGKASDDDFVVLAAKFAQAWDGISPNTGGAQNSIAMLEYHEHNLFVKMQSGLPVPIERIRSALSEHGLILLSNSNGVLKIKASEKGGK
jgi:general secretion pathway protein L